MKTHRKTPRRRWAALGVRTCMVLCLLVAGVMVWFYGTVETGVFEVEPEGLEEMRALVERGETEWVDGQIAWLRMFKTHIDYPVMQTSNNEWYLNHDYLGREYVAGAIFLDCRNSELFDDEVSVIYGHRMNGNLMFSDVARYVNVDYLEEHKYGELILRNGERYELEAVKYVVIADDDELYRDLWFRNEEGIFLSTCEKGERGKRDVLVLTKKDL